MKYIWDKKLFSKATNIVSNFDWQATGISIDTRSLKKGDIFFAFKGEKVDGHNFLEQAVEKGASVIIANNKPEYWPYKIELIICRDHFEILEKMAFFKRKRFTGKIIAITGTVGKTTTKEVLSKIISSQANCYSTIGNFNNKLGLFICLASMKEEKYDYGVFELGMTEIGEISFLSKFLRPDIAIITTITPVHMEFFKSIDELAYAKAEILDGMNHKSILIINKDNDYYDFLINQAFKKSVTNIYSFGKKSICCFRLVNFQLNDHNAEITAEIEESYNYKFNVNFLAEEVALNLLSILGVIYIIGLDLEKAIKELSELKPLTGRGEIKNLYINDKKITIIDDSYNASPASMKASLNMLGNKKHNGRKIAILGDMRELGAQTLQYHEELGNLITLNMIDKIITCGNFIEQVYNSVPDQKKLKHFNNINDLSKILYDLLEDNDLVLLKASYSIGFSRIIKNLEETYAL